jgi:hypothetical protein
MPRSMIAALVALLALGACGDDDAPSTEAAGQTATTTEPGLEADTCDAATAFTATLFGGPEGGPAAAEYTATAILPALDALAAVAPDDLAAPVAALQDAAQAASDAGEAVDETPELGEALNAVSAAVHDGCELTAIDATAIDYGYQGIPATVPAGPASIALTNEGTEEHEIVVFRRNDGVTAGVEELLALPEAEAESMFAFTTATGGAPGETRYAPAELEPGSYFAVCFVSLGGAEDGPPHFTEGMIAEFDVT